MFRLCLALGYPHPSYLENLLTSEQISEWGSYAEAEPFGPLVDMWAAGVTPAVLSNLEMSRRGKRGKYRPADFFPQLRDRPTGKVQSAEEQDKILQAVAAAFGGNKDKADGS